MDEEDRAKLEGVSNELADIRGRVAALGRIARKAEKAGACSRVLAIVAVVTVVAVAVVVAVFLFDNCAATGC